MRKNKYNVVIDTNIIISALATSKNDSPVIKVLKLFYDGKISVYYSIDIINEYKRVLSRKEFNLDKSYVGNFINVFKAKAILINPKDIKEKLIDNKDIPFYALVLDKRINDVKLLTGNIKHFPKKKFIMTAEEFINNHYKM